MLNYNIVFDINFELSVVEMCCQEQFFESAKTAAECYRTEGAEMMESHKQWQQSNEKILDQNLVRLQQIPKSDDEDGLAPIKDGLVSESDDDEDMGFNSAGFSQRVPVAAIKEVDSRFRKRIPHTASTGSNATGEEKGLRPQASAASFEKVRSAFQQNQETYSEDKLWDRKIRIRTVQSMGKTLCGLASPLSNSGCPEAEQFCQQVMSFAEDTEAKHNLFSQLRQAPVAAVSALTEDQQDLLQKVSPAVLSSILVWIGSQILKELDSEKQEVATARASEFFKLMSVKHSSGISVACYFDSMAKESSSSSDVHRIEGPSRLLQVQLFGMWQDKVFRLSRNGKFARAVKALLGCVRMAKFSSMIQL